MRRMKLDAFCSGLSFALALSALVLISAGPATAATIVLEYGGTPSGWEVDIPDSWYNLGFADVATDAVNVGSSVEIQKTGQFHVDNVLTLTFNQVAADAVPVIIINDEAITNSTGTAWNGFLMEILDAGDAWFDTGASAGLSIDPFTVATYSMSDTRFVASGGILPDGDTWWPGMSAFNGELVIQTVPGDGVTTPFLTFSLKENPLLVPEPATLGLVALGLVALVLRGRRA
jgi:hypothetical protein